MTTRLLGAFCRIRLSNMNEKVVWHNYFLPTCRAQRIYLFTDIIGGYRPIADKSVCIGIGIFVLR